MTILLLTSLNLLGVFEFTRWQRLGTPDELASREGASGAFMNGVFTTLLATRCTAPALSVALGFAYAQAPEMLVLILLTVGLAWRFFTCCFASFLPG